MIDVVSYDVWSTPDLFIRVDLIEGTGELKAVTPELYAEAEVLFG